MTNPTCTIDGCAKPRSSSSKLYCGMHYARVKRHGSPHITGLTSIAASALTVQVLAVK